MSFFLGADTSNECIKVGEEYKGTRDYTYKGIKCQAWNTNTPTAVPSSNILCKVYLWSVENILSIVLNIAEYLKLMQSFML